MKRRKAIASIFILGGSLAATYSGFKWYNLSKSPDMGFMDQNKAMIAELAEIIIPRTDSPGAKDVKAEDTIISLIKKSGNRKLQNNFIDGLKDVHEYSNDEYGKNFNSLNAGEKNKVAQHFYEKGKNYSGVLGKAKNKILGQSFFDILKQYTSVAYCTSKQGSTEGLAYDYIPGNYISCMPLAVNQKSWATK